MKKQIRKTNKFKKNRVKKTKVKKNKKSKSKTHKFNPFIFLEKKIYREQNGQVLENSNIIEESNNKKMIIKGYKNGKRINYTRKL
jgi:hypothetical protein